jgi:predicted Zn-dependent protease
MPSCLALICCCALLLQQAPREGSAEWHRNAGLASYSAGNLQETLQHLQQAIRLEPNNEQYYLDLGEVLAQNNARTAVVAVFEAARKALPDSARIRSALGVAYLNVRDYERAKQIFSGLVQAHPEHEQGYQLLAECLDITQDWENTARIAAELRARNPRNRQGWYYGATGEYGQRKRSGESLQLAESYVRRALELGPDDWRPHLLLGKILADTHRDLEAVASLRRAIELKSDDPKTYYVLGQVFKRLGKSAESKAAFDAYHEARAARNVTQRSLVVDIR